MSIDPKKDIGSNKAPMAYVPLEPLVELNNVMACGAYKYGPFNYREGQVEASTYLGAIQRHMFLWFSGVDSDDESGMSHLAHIMACCAILIDCQRSGTLIDNRSKTKDMKKVLTKSEKQFRKFKDGYNGTRLDCTL